MNVFLGWLLLAIVAVQATVCSSLAMDTLYGRPAKTHWPSLLASAVIASVIHVAPIWFTAFALTKFGVRLLGGAS